MLKLHGWFSVNCSFLFPKFVLRYWKEIGRQAATSSSIDRYRTFVLERIYCAVKLCRYTLREKRFAKQKLHLCGLPRPSFVKRFAENAFSKRKRLKSLVKLAEKNDFLLQKICIIC